MLGYAQQVFTYTLDRKAQTLLDGLPAKDPTVAPTRGRRATDGRRRRSSARDRGDGPALVPPAGRAADRGDRPAGRDVDRQRTELEVQPAPPDADDLVQDDGSRPMPNVPVGDHR